MTALAQVNQLNFSEWYLILLDEVKRHDLLDDEVVKDIDNWFRYYNYNVSPVDAFYDEFPTLTRDLMTTD